MYSPMGSGYGYSPTTQMDRLNISASDPRSQTADYGPRVDNGYIPTSYG